MIDYALMGVGTKCAWLSKELVPSLKFGHGLYCFSHGKTQVRFPVSLLTE